MSKKLICKRNMEWSSRALIGKKKTILNNISHEGKKKCMKTKYFVLNNSLPDSVFLIYL